ncbi:MAG: hypothetical protein V3W32_06855 [Gemmatimonadota bacterium]
MGRVPDPTDERVPYCPALGILHARDLTGDYLGWKAPGPLAGPKLLQAWTEAMLCADKWGNPEYAPEVLTIHIWIEALPFLEEERAGIMRGEVPARLREEKKDG